MHTKLTIGLFGFGVVGEGIYHVLKETPSLNASIKKICIKHPEKKRNAPEHLFTCNYNDLLEDEDINVIVELIDDADEAFKIGSIALKKKKALVSANKKMIAKNLETLLQIKKETNTSFLYEAAVCGSIPIIRNLEEYYDNDLLNSFTGIINGSTNYILTKINEEGSSFEEALKQAQDLGFAESDPSLDVEGIDSANKLSIILKHIYGIAPDPKILFHYGITNVKPFDSKFAKEKGFRIKLLAKAFRKNDGAVSAYVMPSFVSSDHPLFNVHNEFNGVLLGSHFSDEQFLYGKGAGRYPTASAVLSDIAALRYGYKYEYKKSENSAYYLEKSFELKLYVSSSEKIEASYFTTVYETYTTQTHSFVIGTISLENLKKSNWTKNKNISLIESV